MIGRRGFLAGLAVALAAPAIIRTPGLLMPVKPPLDDFSTNNLLVRATMRHAFAWWDNRLENCALLTEKSLETLLVEIKRERNWMGRNIQI